MKIENKRPADTVRGAKGGLKPLCDATSVGRRAELFLPEDIFFVLKNSTDSTNKAYLKRELYFKNIEGPPEAQV